MKNFSKLLTLSLMIFAFERAHSAETQSKINLEVSLKKSAIQNIVEKDVPKDFSGNGTLVGSDAASSSGNKLLGFGLSILKEIKPKLNYNILWKYTLQRGEIDFTVNNNTLLAATPFTGTVTGTLEKGDKGKAVSTNFDGALGVASNFLITPNWDLRAQTSPKLTLNNTTLPLKFDVAGIPINENLNLGHELEKQITPLLTKAGSEIDSKIAEVNLKEYVNREWTLLKEPISVEKDYDAWLVVRPKKASYGNIRAVNDRLNVVVGADTDLALYIGKPTKISPLGELPKINMLERDNDFLINLPVIANYENIQNELNNNIGEKTFPIGYGTKVTINNTTLTGVKDLFNLKTDFVLDVWGMFTLKGVLGAEGKPELTPDKKVLKVENFAFNIASDSFIIRMADKIFHNMILKKIKENYLSLDLSRDIPKLQKIAAEKARSITLSKDMILKNDIKSLDIQDISITEKEIIIFTQIKGSSLLEINSL